MVAEKGFSGCQSQEIIARGDNDQDSDILLLGSIVCISACLPNLSGVYADRSYWPNLYLFVTAQASSGKGRLTLCKHIIQPIHDRLREINEAEVMEYKQKMQEFNANKKKMTMDKPDEPPLRMLFLPANASSTAFIQVLNENNGRGIMFETEGDTLANTFASDYGNYSDHFRKFTHHEAVSYVRRKDREFVCVNQPCVSCVLSGTPKQVSSLIPDAENGLSAASFSTTLLALTNGKMYLPDVKTAQPTNSFRLWVAASTTSTKFSSSLAMWNTN